MFSETAVRQSEPRNRSSRTPWAPFFMTCRRSLASHRNNSYDSRIIVERIGPRSLASFCEAYNSSQRDATNTGHGAASYKPSSSRVTTALPASRPGVSNSQPTSASAPALRNFDRQRDRRYHGFHRHPPTSAPSLQSRLPLPLPPAWPHPPLEPRALLFAIRDCPDLDTLLRLLRNHERSLNVRHLDVALGRLGRLTAAAAEGSRDGDGGAAAATAMAVSAAARAAAARLLSSVLPAAAAAAPLTPRDCASVLSALARLELPPGPAAAALLQGALLAQLRSASVRDVAQLLHASAKLRLGLPEGALSTLLGRLDGELAATGKPQDVSMVLWALATLEPQSSSCPSPPRGPLLDWLARLAAQLPPGRLAAFQPQALSNTAWALARLGWRPGGSEWLGALVGASGGMMESFTTAELVNLLWALAAMRHPPPPPWTARALGLLRDRAGSMTPQDVSSLCWSLAVLRLRPGLPLLQRLVARALALRTQLGPQALVTTLWGLSRLGVQVPERAVALLLQGGMGAPALYGTPALAAGRRRPYANGLGGGGSGISAARGAGVPRLPLATVAAGREAGPGDLAGAALVLSYCRHVPSRRWLVRYCAAVSRQLHRFGPRELSTLLYGIGRLGPMGLRLDPHWLDRVLVEVERLAAPRATPTPPAQHLSNSSGHGGVGGVGGNAVTRGELRSEAVPKTTEAAAATAAQAAAKMAAAAAAGFADRLDSSQLAVVLWAVARLGHRPPPGAWVAAMARHVAERAEEFGPRDAATTIRALQELAAATASRRSAPAVPALSRGVITSTTGSCSSSSSSNGGSNMKLGLALDRAPRRLASRATRGRCSSGNTAGGGSGKFSTSSNRSGNNSSSMSGSSGTCEDAVAALVARLAGSLPERSLYGTLRAASLSHGGMSYATVADQLLTDVYSVRSLGLLQRGPARDSVEGRARGSGGGGDGAGLVGSAG